MSDLLAISECLYEFVSTEDIIYFGTPEIADFRKRQGPLVLRGRHSELEIPINYDRLSTFVGMLLESVFAPGKIVITWNIKAFVTHLRYFLGRRKIVFAARIHDLQVLERFRNLDLEPPTTFMLAMQRLRKVKDTALMALHDQVHLPLALRVLPDIESYGVSEMHGKRVYSNYNIEATKNGRLSCTKAFDDCFTPHNMSLEEKSFLLPGHEAVFAAIDYKNMEVAMLWWLSGDNKLGKIIESGRDLYSIVYQIFFDEACDAAKRQMMKSVLLPVFYGMQVEALASTVGDIAKDLVQKIKHHFPIAVKWLDDQQDKAARHKWVEDFFGRKRECPEAHVARNAVVQGPAAIVCQEKLIQLHDILNEHGRLIAHIHDAYVMIVPLADLDGTVRAAKAILESPSNLCPGLRLRVECKTGEKLDKLSNYKI